MKTTVINLEGIESVLSPAGVEKQLCNTKGSNGHDQINPLDSAKGQSSPSNIVGLLS